MSQVQTMTLDERLDIACESAKLWQNGNTEDSTRLLRTIPLPPYLAKIYKERIGIQHLIESGWNLSEAEAEFGEDWLTK